MLKSSVALLLLWVCWLPFSGCQSPPRPAKITLTAADSARFSFIKMEENRIENSPFLDPVFQKMWEQRVKTGQKISIVHIGDSHILGDFLTRFVRERLQKEFGNAGRGLIFPYRQAGTNGPSDYVFEGKGGWSANDLNTAKNDVPVGVAGFSVASTNADGSLRLILRTDSSDIGRLSKLTIFHPNTETAFDFEITDNDHPEAEKAMPVIDGDWFTSYYFDNPTGELTIKNLRKSPGQKSCRIDGICIENELSGIIYHAIGVNGARIEHFTNAKFFSKQVADLNPDLIIISLGTNEGQNDDLSENDIKKQVVELVEKLRESCGSPAFLLTTPADSYLRGKGFNPHMARISRGIVAAAKESGAGYWDLFEVTGGQNSSQKWRNAGLFTRDSVHYTREGYQVQGKLFFQAMMNGYNEFVNNNSINK